MILSCSISREGVDDSEITEELDGLGRALEAKKYGFADVEADILGVYSKDVWNWLRTAMSS